MEAGAELPAGAVLAEFDGAIVLGVAADFCAGRYSGPVWPQAGNTIESNTAIEIPAKHFKFRNDFTIRMTNYEYFSECSMTESEFMALAEATLDHIEAELEQAAQASDLDIECSRSGNILEIEFVDTGSKIIINSQAPMKELWIAAKSGGFHFRRDGVRWINTRDGSELFAALSTLVSGQSGYALVLHPERES